MEFHSTAEVIRTSSNFATRAFIKLSCLCFSALNRNISSLTEEEDTWTALGLDASRCALSTAIPVLDANDAEFKIDMMTSLLC